MNFASDRTKGIRIGILTAAAAFCLAIFAGPAMAVPQGGTYYYPLQTDPPNLDPAQITDTTSHAVAVLIFDGLLTFNHDLKLVGDIAESWDISYDGMEYTFYLKKNVRFHNGRKLTAADFVYSFTRIMQKETASPRFQWVEPIAGAKEVFEGKAKTPSGLKAVDDYTLKIKLTAPYAPFLNHLAQITLSAVPKEEVEAKGKDFGLSPVGTGPFIFGKWTHNSSIELSRFDKYHRGKPNLDKIQFRIFPGESCRTMLEEFKAGRLHHTLVCPDLVQQVKKDKVLREQMKEKLRMGITYYGFNLEKAPWKDNRTLRQAINLAVDRDFICEEVLQGDCEPTPGVLPMAMSAWFNTELVSYPHNRAKAAEYLAKAGYPKGKGLPPITLWYNVQAPNKDIAEAIQDDLKRIGIKVELKGMEWAAYLDAVDAGEPGFFRMGWVADYPDPDNFLYVMFHTNNFGPAGNYTHYSHPKVDELLIKAQKITNDDERRKIYHLVEKQIVQDAPWLFLFTRKDRLLFRPDVKGLKLTAMDSGGELPYVDYANIWLE